MNKAKSNPRYSRKKAASLICASYNQFGSNLDAATMQKSILEDSLGDVPESWNEGLFRFLDEVIYMFRIVEWFSTAAAGNDHSYRAQMILCHQVVKNLLAIRILSGSGLDGSARQNLRALYEMCHALCRCLVDTDFMMDFKNQSTLESANEFWHRYMAKLGTEKFLKDYNKTADNKCLLVVGDTFDMAFKVLGVGAHPNHLGWSIEWSADFSDPLGMEDMFNFSPHRSSEFVLSTASRLSLATLNFVSSKIAEISSPLDLLNKIPAFQQYGDDLEALNGIGKTASLMFIFLAKWTNRNKPNFDPQVHF